VRETDAVHLIFRGGHLHGRDCTEMTTTLPACRDDEVPLYSGEIACFSPLQRCVIVIGMGRHRTSFGGR
jgi:hypothetical protein